MLESDVTAKNTATTASTGNTTLLMRESWDATVRARVGYATGNALIFGTGGVAVADRTLSFNSSSLATTFNGARLGTVFGGGVEYKLAPQISARLEALRYTFTDQQVSWNSNAQSVKESSNVMRAGVSLYLN